MMIQPFMLGSATLKRNRQTAEIQSPAEIITYNFYNIFITQLCGI